METKAPNDTSKFLWSLAGFNPDAIAKNKIDGFHASIIGALLLIVGIYATLAWTFFFQTVTDNIYISILGGIFMGLFIVNFDRALIASLSTHKTNMFSLIFRFILALLLGIFLSQPMILKFYQPEIKKEAEILYLKKIDEQKATIKTLYQNDIDNLKSRKEALQNELTAKEGQLLSSEKDFKEEMDGTGGTKRRGYSVISKQKEKIYNKHKDEFSALQSKNTVEIDSIKSQLNQLETKIFNETEQFKNANTNFGTLIQVEALHSLLNKDKTGSLKMRYYLLSVILILIELSALIAKLLFRTRNYKNNIALINEMEEKHLENEKEIALSLIKTEKEHIINSNKESVETFFESAKPLKKDKTDKLLTEWNDSKSPFNSFWKKFKGAFTIRD